MYQYLLQKNAKLKHLSMLLIVICKTLITACCHCKEEMYKMPLGEENEEPFGKRRSPPPGDSLRPVPPHCCCPIKGSCQYIWDVLAHNSKMVRLLASLRGVIDFNGNNI